MRSQLRVTATLMMLAVCLTVFTAGPTVAADPCPIGDHDCSGKPSTTGDQQHGSIVTSGVSFPGVDPSSDLGKAIHQANGCKDCEWSVVPACVSTGPADADLTCMGAAASCPDPGDIRYRVYMRHGTGQWQLQGSVCLGPGERPATVADVGQAIRAQVVNYLPSARPSFQPKAGGLVNLPTIFAAGEPQTITTKPFDVMGFTVVVTAHARWEWTFDEGVVKDFAEPGGAYPDTAVSYTYADSGARQVSVTTYWRAEFTVDGQGPFQVPGPEISKTAGPIAVPVRQAHSELVRG